MSSQGTLTRVLESGKIPTKFPRLQLQVLDIRYIAEVSGHGSGLYVRIPKEVVDFYGIVAGDRIKVALLQRKNWRDVEEEPTR